MRKSVAPVITAAFLIRFALLVLNTLFITLPESGKDDRRFESTAWEWSRVAEIPKDQLAEAETGAGVFIKCGAALYSIMGRVPFVWGLIMVILGTTTVYNIYKSTYLLWEDNNQAIRVAWFATLFPEFAMLSALLLRETVMHFFLSFAVLELIKFWKYKKKFSIVTFLFYVGMCVLFHSAMITILIGFGLATFLVSQDGKKKSGIYKIAAIILAIGGLMFINYTGFGLSKFGGSLDVDNIYGKFESQESREAVGNAAYPDWLKITDGASGTWKMPIRVAALLFAPAVPFMVKTVGHLVGVIDAFFYLAMFYSYYKNRKTIKANKTANVIFIMSVTLALVYSLGVSNFGTAIRHRAKLLPLFLVLAVDFKALKKSQLRKKKRMLALKEQKLKIQSSV